MTKKNKIILSTLSILLVFSVLLFLLAPKPQPSPRGNVLVTPTVSSPITYPTYTAPNARPRLNVTWQVTATDIPTDLPYYKSSLPLLGKTYIQQLAARLGFSDADLKKDTLTTTLLYINGNKSLFASTSNRELTYTNTAVPKTVSKWADTATISQSLLRQINDLLANSNLELQPQSEISFLKSTPTGYEPALPNSAQLAQITFTQTINGYPYLTVSSTNALINLIIDTKYVPYYLEIHGGVNSPTKVATQSLIDFATLKQIAPTKAEQISSPQNLELTNAITTSPFLDLTVTAVQVAYFNDPKSDLILPALILKGTVSASGIPSTPVSFMVPAYK